MRAVRLAALAESPEMFGSTLGREQTFDEAEWRGRAERPATFLAVRDGRDVGLAGVYDLDGTWWLMGMWVEPSARGTGVVEALVGACLSAAAVAGATQVTLGVMEGNDRGRRAYERLGFVATGERVLVREGAWEMLMVKGTSGGGVGPRSTPPGHQQAGSTWRSLHYVARGVAWQVRRIPDFVP